MSLPVKTTLEDIEALLGYLKRKALGVTLNEAESVLDHRFLDGRKLSALEAWGLISREDDRLSLTRLGRRGTRKEEDKAAMFGEVLRSIRAYRTALEWANEQNLESIEAVDLASRWNEYNQDEVETSNERTLRDNVICFFHLAQGAGLGRLVIGRRGAETRFDTDRSALTSFIEGGEVVLPVEEEKPEIVEALPDEEIEKVPPGVTPEVEVPAGPVKKVFVAHGKNKAILDQVKELLVLGDFEAYVAAEEETAGIPVPQKVVEGMHQCQAAVINVAAEEPVTDEQGNETFLVNQNVLIEIGGAAILYGYDRVILLWDKRVPVPSDLQGLYRCEYEGDELSLEVGMKLLKTLAKLRE